jgi:hypothetical protein
LRIRFFDVGAGGHGDDGAKPGEDRQEVATHPIGRICPGWDSGGGQVLLWSGDPPEECMRVEQESLHR